MVKKIFQFLFFILILGCSSHNIETTIINGETYYVIDSEEDLKWLSNPELFISSGSVSKEKALKYKLSVNYIQTKNIELSKELFIPIGSKENPFSGTYNGKGHTISNLHINIKDGEQIGLFGVLENSKLDSINLVNVSITGKNSVGGLAGTDYKSIIRNCNVSGNLKSEKFQDVGHSSSELGGLIGEKINGNIENSSFIGKLKGNYSVGGIVGYLDKGIIRNSYTMSEIEGGAQVGGIVGVNEGDYDYEEGTSQNEIGPGSINNCFSSSIITGVMKDIGGIVGKSTIGSIFNCYFNGSIYGHNNVGGIIGDDTSSLISNCYNSGTIKSDGDFVGGIVGEMDDFYSEYDSFINGSYSTGNVKGEDKVGGIAGYISGDIINSYSSSNVIGKKCVGGIVGESEPNSLISKTYAIGKIIGKEHIGGIAGEVSGMNVTTKDDELLFKGLAEGLNENLKKLGAQVKTVKKGNISYAIVKNSYWDSVATNQNKGVGKINYFSNNKKQINGTKSLSKTDFLKETNFGKTWGINTKKSIWNIKKAKGLSSRPFLKWEKVVIQQVDNGKEIKFIVINNKNKNPITKIGYLNSTDTSFASKVDTLCVQKILIKTDSIKEIKPCLNTSTKYKRIFVQDNSGNMWLGKVFE